MSVVVVAPANANQRIDSSATTSSSREDLIKASSTGSDSEVRPQDSQGQPQGSVTTPVRGNGNQAADKSAGAGAAVAGTPDTPDGEGDNVSTGTTLTTPGDELPPPASGGGATALTAPPSGVTNPKSSSSTMDPLMRSSSSNHPQGSTVQSDGNGNHNQAQMTTGNQAPHLAPGAARTGSTGGRINDAYTSNPDIELQSYGATGRRKHGVVEFYPPHHGDSSCSTTDFNTNCQSLKDSSYDKNLQLVGLNPMFGSGSGLSTVYEAEGSKAPGMFARDHLGGSVDALQVG